MDNNMENKVVFLRLDDIIPNRFQPREVFDENELEELASSIKEHGVIQPIIVRQFGDKYELIAGERRSKASALAGLTTIPAIIRNMDDKESAKVSLLENLQRKNLSAIEEARTYERIIELDNMTQSELAKTMGKSQPMIANKLRLLSLPIEVQNALTKNQISERHARSLLNVKDKEQQLALLDKIRNERMTVRELENYIKDMNATNNQIINQQNNYQSFSNFNGMGLNDYQSTVNNNMLNNIPNNQFSNSESNRFSNLSAITTPNDNTLDFNYNAFSSQSNTSDNQDNSLASMFDGNLNNNNDYSNDNSTNKNIFISKIKEDEVNTTENQFLPNFQDKQDEFNINTVNNTDNSYQSTINNTDNSYQPLTNNNDTNINNINNINNIGYQSNQGALFNQPLNIVDVPNNQINEEIESNNFKEEATDQELNNFRFNNPFDDKYENILFAKPVAINQETNNLETPDLTPIENQEISNKEETKDETSKYITIDPVKTIFSAYDAVYELKKTTDRIKKDGINLESEEINFDDYYQIIIKIKKEQEL